MPKQEDVIVYRQFKGKFGGHVSLEMPYKNIYMSFWPRGSGKNFIMQLFDTREAVGRTYEYDLQHSNGIETQICLFSLDRG